ncbi:MAG: hypothetical protein WC623_21990 [Pedobacter sp.]|uniref:hypothetical protein n=1 Tax=Pedobacter sp. TaxID=1411316 RepID=UPI0035643803
MKNCISISNIQKEFISARETARELCTGKLCKYTDIVSVLREKYPDITDTEIVSILSHKDFVIFDHRYKIDSGDTIYYIHKPYFGLFGTTIKETKLAVRTTYHEYIIFYPNCTDGNIRKRLQAMTPKEVFMISNATYYDVYRECGIPFIEEDNKVYQMSDRGYEIKKYLGVLCDKNGNEIREK